MAINQLTDFPPPVRHPRHPKFKDLTGQTMPSGVTILHYCGGNGKGSRWVCQCACGQFFVGGGTSLTRGETVKCLECRDPTIMPEMQECYSCKKVLPFTGEFFVKSDQKKFGLHRTCKKCNNPINAELGRKNRKETRLKVLAHYSGGTPRCCCCGETIIEFLAVDHVYGEGRKEREQYGNHSHKLCRAIIKQGFPDRYRVLCHNCNSCVKLLGYCIHNPATIKSHLPIRPKAENILVPVEPSHPGQLQICIHCERLFPVAETFFSKHSKMASGFLNMCKDCGRHRAFESYGELREKRKRLVFSHYSGVNKPRCCCCGLEDIAFLTIDHIHGGGTEHRKEVGPNILFWLIKNKFPPGFATLCFNCNMAKGFYGKCPHAIGELF